MKDVKCIKEEQKNETNPRLEFTLKTVVGRTAGIAVCILFNL